MSRSLLPTAPEGLGGPFVAPISSIPNAPPPAPSPAMAPSQPPVPSDDSPPYVAASGPLAAVDMTVHSIFIASWVAILAVVGVVFISIAMAMGIRTIRGLSPGPCTVTVPGRRAEISSSSAQDGKIEAGDVQSMRRVIVELPNDDICCGMELAPHDGSAAAACTTA